MLGTILRGVDPLWVLKKWGGFWKRRRGHELSKFCRRIREIGEIWDKPSSVDGLAVPPSAMLVLVLLYRERGAAVVVDVVVEEAVYACTSRSRHVLIPALE
jgi:hypothetical protein